MRPKYAVCFMCFSSIYIWGYSDLDDAMPHIYLQMELETRVQELEKELESFHRSANVTESASQTDPSSACPTSDSCIQVSVSINMTGLRITQLIVSSESYYSIVSLCTFIDQ